MATVKLTGVDEIHNSTTSFTVSDAASLLQTLNLNVINPADGQVLAYSSSSGQWVNSTAAGGGGGTTLSDVGITFDVQAGDNVWEVDPTPSTTAFSVQKSVDGDGSINFDFPANP